MCKFADRTYIKFKTNEKQMKKRLFTLKTIGLLTALMFAFVGCSKIDYITTYADTYTAQSSGNTEFFKSGGKFDQMKASNKNLYYISPQVLVVTGSSDVTVNDASATFIQKIEDQLFSLGYVKTLTPENADFFVQATNFKLVYMNINWVPSAYLDPYYEFWGGYTPWLGFPPASIATNKLLIELVEAESMRTYRDWYNNIWKPANAGKFPSPANVPGDKKPVMAWQAEISGELEDNKTADNTRLMERVEKVFTQTAIKIDDKGALIPFPVGSYLFSKEIEPAKI